MHKVYRIVDEGETCSVLVTNIGRRGDLEDPKVDWVFVAQFPKAGRDAFVTKRNLSLFATPYRWLSFWASHEDGLALCSIEP